MFGLNIHLKSFKLNPSIASGNDKIRVSITTFPEQNKEAFITEAKQMFCVHHFFTVNVSEKTERIVFVFRKIGLFDDPIIASTTINSKDIPIKKVNDETEMITFKVYEPVQNGHKNRRIYGEMQVQFSLTSAFPTFNKKQNKNKNNNNNNNSNNKNKNKNNNYCNNYNNNSKLSQIQKPNKMNGYSKIDNNNQDIYYSVFNDIN